MLEGVTKRLMKSWFDSKFHSTPHIGRHKQQIDIQFCNQRPPREFSRPPRSITKHLNYWKASELKQWLLFFTIGLFTFSLLAPFCITGVSYAHLAQWQYHICSNWCSGSNDHWFLCFATRIIWRCQLYCQCALAYSFGKVCLIVGSPLDALCIRFWKQKWAAKVIVPWKVQHHASASFQCWCVTRYSKYTCILLSVNQRKWLPISTIRITWFLDPTWCV